MPAATPLPRRPAVLMLGSAEDLLTGPGCPVCRYAGEAADRYLTWFALESHARADTITRLCASLGMCPRHTRALMRQPGAAIRLTAVYRYVLAAARDRLDGRLGRLGRCPACENDHSATDRAVETLVAGLADDRTRVRYRELGGLCLPHLRAASARSDRRLAAWLSVTATTAAAATDHDAQARAALRQQAVASSQPAGQACCACWAAGRAESDRLMQMMRAASARPAGHRWLLCAGHLGDLVVLAGRRTAVTLAWQAGCLADGMARRRGAAGHMPCGPAGWVRSWGRRGDDRDACPVCKTAGDAARRAVDDVRHSLDVPPPVPGQHTSLCVRHVLFLQRMDQRAGQVMARCAAGRSETLLAELDEAFGKNTWAGRHLARGPEMTAWRRAAAFLDGQVFCGGSPPDT